MSSNTITRNDLKNILNEVLPVPPSPIVSLHFVLTPPSYASGSKQQTLPVSLPSGYKLLCPNMVGSYVSGNATCVITDNTISASGATLSIDYYLYNPNNATNLIIHGNVLCERIQ